MTVRLLTNIGRLWTGHEIFGNAAILVHNDRIAWVGRAADLPQSVPGVVDDILAGIVHEFEIGPTFVAIALTLMAIPILMILLSTTLPARVNRTINLVVATLYIPVSMYNAVGESWTYFYFYGLSIGLEVLLLAFILRSAWTWPRRTASPATLAASLDSEPLRTQRQA